jgi:hypothetical protein
MQFHTFPRCQLPTVRRTLCLVECWDIRRRRRRRGAHEYFHDPFPPKNRGGSVGHRSQKEYTPMPQKPSTCLIWVPDSPKLRTRNPWNSIVSGKIFIDKGIIGIQKLEKAPVLSYQVVEKQLRLPDHRLAKLAVEVRVEVRFWLVLSCILKP